MHPLSLGFTLNIARASMRGEEGFKAFAFQGWGAQHVSSVFVTERFYKSDFALAHNDPRLITVFAPSGTESAIDCLSLPRLSERKQSEPRRGLRRLQNLRRTLSGGAPLFPSKPPPPLYEPVSYSSNSNPISKSILSGRQSDMHTRTVGLEEVNRFYTNLLGTEDHLNPDERFMMIAGVHEA